PERYPQGHPVLAISLNNLAGLLMARGEYGPAQEYYEEALAINQKLYSPEAYPQGHRDLATSLNNLGGLHMVRGEYGPAQIYLQQALAMLQGLASAFADTASEAEAFNFLAKLPKARDAFLTMTARPPPADAGGQYALLWQGRAALTRVLEGRQRLLR